MEFPPKAVVESDIMVPMRDGVQLAVDIYRPEGEGPWPTLLAMSSYGKNTQRQLLPQPVPSPLSDACIEAGWTDDLVERGYVHVIACSRGTGQSEGAYRQMYSPQESEDGYDLVEWIAGQVWCDGNVGMFGISYFGTVQLVVASARPPHLKAIAPFEATCDQYFACYHGGVLDGFYSELFTGRHTTLGWSGFQPTNVESKTIAEQPTEAVRERIEAAKTDPDITQYNLLYSILDCPEKNPVFFDILLHPYDDQGEFYWWDPDLSQIDIPVFCGNAWYPDCGPKFVRGPFMIWEGVQGPKKMLMVPPGWLERPYHQYHEPMLRWFDHWLKGEDNGVAEEEPICLWVMGEETYRDEREWPLARTEWTDFYLRTHGRLATTPERLNGLQPDGYMQAPLGVTDQAKKLTYSTGPLANDLEVTGPITLYLHAALDGGDGWFKASIWDIAPDGRRRELTHGFLKCSHRHLNESRSRPWQPIHDHTAEGVAPVEPGQVEEYAIELYPFANVFRAGHQIVLEVSSAEVPGASFSYHVTSSRTTAYKVFRDRGHPSRLYLPVIPR